jgi:hypothetical protein
LLGRHPEAILPSGRRTGFPCGHRPELVEILGNDNEPFALGEERMGCSAGDRALRVGGIAGRLRQ